MPKTKSAYVAIDWKPDKNLKQPLHRQIIEFVVKKVSAGEWLIGDKLPSQRQLSVLFNVNRSTVVEALSELTSLEVIEAHYGNGTRIANNTWSLLVSSAPPNWGRYISSGSHGSNLPTIQEINKYEYIPGILKISTGELGPGLLPSVLIEKSLENVIQAHPRMSYLEPLGLFELREALAVRFREMGMNVTPANILIVSGSLQALHLISIGILASNSTVFVENLSYVRSLQIFQSAKIHVQEVFMDADGIIPTMIDSKISSGKPSLLYTIPTFHNPTGITMPEKRRHELIDWCKLNQLPIIEDNAYCELWIDSPPPPPLKSFDENGMVLHLGTVSKSFSPGFRLGWIVAPEPVVSHLGDIKMQLDYGANTIAQWAFTNILASGEYDAHLVDLRQRLGRQRDYMLALLEKNFSDIASWNHPRGGFYIWLKMKSNIPASKIFDLALKQKILINPGGIYSNYDNQCIRLSYAYCSPAEMKSALTRLATIIRKQSKLIK
ncbi:MAG: PLP-dependent aminotransferase family protein [Eubacteriales bacterium]